MTASYHERSNAAPARGKWARGFVAAGFALALGGCSVSMPMSGLMDSASTDGLAARAPSDAAVGASKEQAVVEVAAAKPEL